MLHRFTSDITHIMIPDEIYDPFALTPHPIAQVAAKELQIWLKANKELSQYFDFNNQENRYGKGKMMGVLVVQQNDQSLGYLTGFSGKLNDNNHYHGFVPPIYNVLQKGGFVSVGLNEVKTMTARIKELKNSKNHTDRQEIINLTKARKAKTKNIQEKLYRQYHFLNSNGIKKGLYEIFQNESNPSPPSGSGECAAPKMIQYAYQHQLKPIALAEFWWGLDSLSGLKKHMEYYPSCEEKCRPILRHMI